MKQFALPVVGLAVIAAYWLWRGTQAAPAPETTATGRPAAPPTATTAPRESGGTSPPKSAAGAKPPGAAPAPPSTRAGTTRTTRSDRASTDGLRQQLRTLHRTTSSRTQAADEPPGAGKLDAEYIQARIREDLVPIAQECYESALEDDPKLGGKLVMSFTIVGDPSVGGVVDEAASDPSSEITQPDLLECMKESMLSLSFPPPEDGGTVSVTYPFVFASDGPPAKP